MKKDSRYVYITIAQIIAMLLIVFSHSFPDRIEAPQSIYECVVYIQSAGLTLFMFVSGFLFERTKQIEKYGCMGVIKHRAMRLLIPYVVMQILMLMPKYFIGMLTGTKVEIAIVSVLKSFLYPRQGILPHLWFLPTLFLISILCCSIYSWMKRGRNLVIVLILSVAVSLNNFDIGLFVISDVLNLFMWFIFGIVTATYKLERYLQRKSLSALILSGGGYMLFLLLSAETPFVDDMMSILQSVCSIAFILVLCMLLEKCSTEGVLRFGKYTFTIYILSLPIQNIMEIIFMRIGFGWIADMAGMFVTGIFIPLGVGICVGMIEKKMKIRWVSKIIGLT